MSYSFIVLRSRFSTLFKMITYPTIYMFSGTRVFKVLPASCNVSIFSFSMTNLLFIPSWVDGANTGLGHINIYTCFPAYFGYVSQ